MLSVPLDVRIFLGRPGYAWQPQFAIRSGSRAWSSRMRFGALTLPKSKQKRREELNFFIFFFGPFLRFLVEIA